MHEHVFFYYFNSNAVILPIEMNANCAVAAEIEHNQDPLWILTKMFFRICNLQYNSHVLVFYIHFVMRSKRYELNGICWGPLHAPKMQWWNEFTHAAFGFDQQIEQRVAALIGDVAAAATAGFWLANWIVCVIANFVSIPRVCINSLTIFTIMRMKKHNNWTNTCGIVQVPST